MEDKILITNIQRFSLHDGPGIRTTIFLKGCTVHCPWCANPENISSEQQAYYTTDASGKVESGVYGKWVSVDRIYEEAIKDKLFYDLGNQDMEQHGGITYSGGEPLMQVRQLFPLMRMFMEAGIPQAVETALFIGQEAIEAALQNIDIFIVDIKILDFDQCALIIGGNAGRYLENLRYLYEEIRRRNKILIYRFPYICGYTDSEENIRSVVRLIETYPPLYVDILVGHNLGRKKYDSLGIKSPELPDVSDESIEILQRMEKCRKMVEAVGVKANICFI